MSDGVLGGVQRAIVKRIDSLTVDLPDGCPHCHFLLVNRPEYDTCPHCGWGPNTEPSKTPEEARAEFLEGIQKELWR